MGALDTVTDGDITIYTYVYRLPSNSANVKIIMNKKPKTCKCLFSLTIETEMSKKRGPYKKHKPKKTQETKRMRELEKFNKLYKKITGKEAP